MSSLHIQGWPPAFELLFTPCTVPVNRKNALALRDYQTQAGPWYWRHHAWSLLRHFKTTSHSFRTLLAQASAWVPIKRIMVCVAAMMPSVEQYHRASRTTKAILLVYVLLYTVHHAETYILWSSSSIQNNLSRYYCSLVDYLSRRFRLSIPRQADGRPAITLTEAFFASQLTSLQTGKDLSLIQLLLPSFLHVDFWHLLSNSRSLLALSLIIEPLLGTKTFIISYFLFAYLTRRITYRLQVAYYSSLPYQNRSLSGLTTLRHSTQINLDERLRRAKISLLRGQPGHFFKAINEARKYGTNLSMLTELQPSVGASAVLHAFSTIQAVAVPSIRVSRIMILNNFFTALSSDGSIMTALLLDSFWRGTDLGRRIMYACGHTSLLGADGATFAFDALCYISGSGLGIGHMSHMVGSAVGMLSWLMVLKAWVQGGRRWLTTQVARVFGRQRDPEPGWWQEYVEQLRHGLEHIKERTTERVSLAQELQGAAGWDWE